MSAKPMKVLEHSPGAWTLLADGHALFFDVQCRRDAFTYSVLLRLDAAESHAASVDGRPFLEQFAAAVRAEATAQPADGGRWIKRDVAPLYAEKMAAAMEAYEGVAPRRARDPDPPTET